MSHGRASLRLHRVRQELPAQGQSPVPHALAQQGQHRRASIQVRPLPKGLYVQGPLGVAQTFALGRAAAQLSRLRQDLRGEGQHASTLAKTPGGGAADASEHRLGNTADNRGFANSYRRCSPRRSYTCASGASSRSAAHGRCADAAGSSSVLLKE